MDQSIAEYDSAVLHYMQPASMTLQQYAIDLVTNWCKVTELYDKGTMNKISIEGDDISTRYHLRHYCAQKLHADLTDVTFSAVRFRQRPFCSF